MLLAIVLSLCLLSNITAGAVRLFIKEGEKYVQLTDDYIVMQWNQRAPIRQQRQADRSRSSERGFGYVNGVRMSREQATALWQNSSPEIRTMLFGQRRAGFANCTVLVNEVREVSIQGSCYRTSTGQPFCQSLPDVGSQSAGIMSLTASECMDPTRDVGNDRTHR